MTVARTTLSGTTSLAADFIEKRLESAKRWFIFTHIELRSQDTGIEAANVFRAQPAGQRGLDRIA
jgi:hypothetical protein